MFEVGCSYNIVMLETGDNYEGKWATYESSMVYEVGAVDGTLVKLLGPDWSREEFEDFLPPGTDRNAPRDETILNTASMFFVRAEKVHKS
ncbi:hypothetical protein [Ensifer sesbaniae]|uniref:hypothetical protein n=1 Tax=Ensifer sesbaniae TaxID=1214071 RepID=UPI00156A1959|nr:hypothetical protein [Ensifer sesbaniae]NRQ15779.1 hypothetical protein [Ensifer sesbaniae]